MQVRPRVFIGSSVEGRPYADAIQVNLQNNGCEATVWHQSVFRPSDFTLGALMRSLGTSDFGVFVFTPDDILIKRGHELKTARNNVIFELGMFVGKLGPSRAFVVAPHEVDGRALSQAFVSDLQGVTVAQFDSMRSDSNWEAALGPACTSIVSRIRHEWSPIQDETAKDYCGGGSRDDVVVIAHCEDDAKFAAEGVGSPGGTLLGELKDMGAADWQSRPAVVTPGTQIDWSLHNERSTVYVVDSPYYNPYSGWLLREYRRYVTPGTVQFVHDQRVTDHVSQWLETSGERFASTKIHGHMGLFDRYRDYLLVMRLPGQVLSQHRFRVDTIWVVAGIHSKASYAGAKLFAPENRRAFVTDLALKCGGELPKYFEAIYEVPIEPNRVDRVGHMALKFVRPLRPRLTADAADGTPVGLHRHFVSGSERTRETIPIDTVHLDPVASCNFACPTCIEQPEIDLRLRLSFKAIVRILSDLHGMGCQYLHFYGGEPTSHPEFAEIVNLAATLGFQMRLVTNGSLLGRDDIRQALIDARDRMHVRVSVNSHSNFTHRLHHGLHRDVFDSILTASTALIEADVNLSVSYLLFAESIRELRAACEHWRSVRARALHLRPLTAVNGRSPALAFSNEEKRVLSETLEHYAGWVMAPEWFANWLQGRPLLLQKQYKECYSAYYRFAVSPYQASEVVVGPKAFLETDRAWISLCTYRRHDQNFGSEYPKDLRSWAGEQRRALIGRLQPCVACNEIVCARDESNRRVLHEVQKFTAP